MRKAIGAATVTLHVKQYLGPPAPPSTSADPVPRIDIEQVATAGVKGTTENRCLDYEFREHSDWLFGHVKGRSRFLGVAELKAWVAGEAKTEGWVEDEFAALDWLEGDGEQKGPAGETLIVNHVVNLDAAGGWTAVQVWGFQSVGGERRYTRNIVVAKGEQFVNFKMVYDYIGDDA